ncbi:hypothetical protein FOL47_009636, partial [Perkinsus chesapeaki]
EANRVDFWPVIRHHAWNDTFLRKGSNEDGKTKETLWSSLGKTTQENHATYLAALDTRAILGDVAKCLISMHGSLHRVERGRGIRSRPGIPEDRPRTVRDAPPAGPSAAAQKMVTASRRRRTAAWKPQAAETHSTIDAARLAGRLVDPSACAGDRSLARWLHGGTGAISIIGRMRLAAIHHFLAIVAVWGNRQNRPTEDQNKPTQVDIPIHNGTGETSHDSSEGLFQHIQSIAFYDDNTNSGIGGIIVTPDGRELLAVTANAQFLSLRLADRGDNLFEIEKLSRDEMLNKRGRVLTQYGCSPWGLASDGDYEGAVKGDFYVTCANTPRPALEVPDPCITLRFKDKTVSDVVFQSDRVSCRTNPAMSAVLKLRGNEDEAENVLLTAFEHRIRFNNLLDLSYTLVQWDTLDKNKASFIFLSGNSQVVSMSQFNNGDVMMLLKRHNAPEGNREMIIAYVTAAAVSARVRSPSTLFPKVLLSLRERDGYNIGDVKGLAIQEDPKTGRSFIYIIGNIYNHAENRLEMQLAKYAWTPKVKSE